jgi:hypothetical protein
MRFCIPVKFPPPVERERRRADSLSEDAHKYWQQEALSLPEGRIVIAMISIAEVGER